MNLSRFFPRCPSPYAPLRNLADRRYFSFRMAVHGMCHTLRTQPNAKIEVAAALFVCVLGLWLQIAAAEWAILGLTIFTILALEAVNTAVEAVVDLLSPQFHPLAKIAKDATAGAMLLAVLGSIGVGLAIFGPRLWQLLVT